MSEKDVIKLAKEGAYGHREQMPNNFSRSIPDAAMMRKAVTMFKDSFNRELNAMVVIELKTGDFKTSYLGQLMGYLTIFDEKVRKPHENTSIGIVLCRSANREYVEFMIRDYTKPMGVATYKTADEMPDKFRRALPSQEELLRLMDESNNE